jgi:uncharacterized protein YjgD (DUF1641 family)
MGTAMHSEPSAAQEQLLARLSEEKTIDALNKLLDRLDVIAFAADALSGFLSRADVVAESVAESVADLKKMTGQETSAGEVISKIPQLAKASVQLADVTANPAFARLLNSDLLDRLGDPKTIQSLKDVLDRLELAAFVLESVDGFLRRSEVIGQALSDDVHDLKMASQPDIAKFKEVLQAMPALVTAGQTLVKSGMLEPRTVEVLGKLGRSAADSFEEAKTAKRDARPLGIFGLLKAIRDPDVNRALDFALHVSKAYGQSLSK